MDRKKIVCFISILIFVCLCFSLNLFVKNNKEIATNELEATVLKVDDSTLTLRDKGSRIYTFDKDDVDAKVGDEVVIEYTGLLDENQNIQQVSVVGYDTVTVAKDENGIPVNYLDDGIFSDFYVMAYDKLKKLTLDEKIGQLLLVRYPNSSAIEDIKKYKFSGFVFFEKDFKNKKQIEVKNMINNLQKASSIPLLTAVDEEGGTVVRVSSNSNLAPYKFKSPQELYNQGGFEKIKEDTIKKSEVLDNLGLNVNLAPVVDVSQNSGDYIYNRTLGKNTSLTSEYAKTVIEASKKGKVSYTLKHFPGYGNNKDTHTSSSTDTRTYDDIVNNDLPPFEAGIKAGAEAVLVSHNIVTNIDPDNPASLSASVHNLLRNKLKFTGVIITDDLSMGAVSTISDVTVKALLAGNDLVITTDYQTSFNSIKNAIDEGRISEELINKLAFKVLAWKYYKGLMLNLK